MINVDIQTYDSLPLLYLLTGVERGLWAQVWCTPIKERGNYSQNSGHIYRAERGDGVTGNPRDRTFGV